MSRPSHYEVTQKQWQLLRAQLPGKEGDPGRSGADNRTFLNGVLWVLRSGARWSDLPECYGKYKTVHKRFIRWADAGVWEKVLAVMFNDVANEYIPIDSTISRARQLAVTRRWATKTRLLDIAEAA